MVETTVTEPAGLKLLVAATPGPLGQWTEQVVRRIVGAIAEKAMETVTLDSDETTERFLSGPQSGPAILFSRYPRASLISYLERVGGAAILALDDPRDVVAHHVHGGPLTATAALRPLSQSLALLAGIDKLPRIAVVGSERYGDPAGRLIADLALALGATAADGYAISRAFQGWRMGTVAESIQSEQIKGASLKERRAGLTDQDSRAIVNAARGLMNLVDGRAAADIIWDRSLFFDGSTMTSPAPGIVEMTGPARCLYYGPYLHLPPGPWEGQLYIGCSDQVSDTRLRIDVFTDAIEGLFVTRMTRGGIFRMPIHFTVSDARLPVQIRIFIDRGEIDGLFAFKQVTLHRAPPGSALEAPGAGEARHKNA